MPNHAKRVDELPLDKQTAGTDDTVRVIADHKQVILVITGRDPVKPLAPLLLSDVADGGQHTEDIEETPLVVGTANRTDSVSLWESSDHFRRDQGTREERGVIGLGVHGGFDGDCNRGRSRGSSGKVGHCDL